MVLLVVKHRHKEEEEMNCLEVEGKEVWCSQEKHWNEVSRPEFPSRLSH